MNQENQVVKARTPKGQTMKRKTPYETDEQRLAAIDGAIRQASAQLLRLTYLRIKFESRIPLTRVK